MNLSHANKTRYCWILVKTLNKSCLKVSVILQASTPSRKRNSFTLTKETVIQCMEYDNLRQKLHQRALYQILRRGRLQVRDFLNTKYSSRMKQRHFGGKTRWPSSFQDEFQQIVSSGNKLSNVRSLSFFTRERA